MGTRRRLTKGVVDVEPANIVHNALNLTSKNDKVLLRFFESLNILWIESVKMVEILCSTFNYASLYVTLTFIFNFETTRTISSRNINLQWKENNLRSLPRSNNSQLYINGWIFFAMASNRQLLEHLDINLGSFCNFRNQKH